MKGVYLVLDPDQVGGRSPVAVAEAALRGGVRAVQWRQKSGSLAVRWPELLAVSALCRSCAVPFLVNDRVDVALAVEADGAHLGQDDLPADAARRLLAGRILGLSITDPSQVEAAERAAADYLGVGPIFATTSKGDASLPMGLALLRRVRSMTGLPLAAIGGIGPDNAREVCEAGADAVAVVSAVCGAPDVEAAAHTLAAMMEGVAVG